MTPEQYVTLRDAISAHIEHEAKRSGTYHGDPAATPGGTGYCIPAAVATGIVDKYLLDFRAAPRAEGPPEGHVIGDRFVSDESFDAAIPAPRAEGHTPTIEDCPDCDDTGLCDVHWLPRRMADR